MRRKNLTKPSKKNFKYYLFSVLSFYLKKNNFHDYIIMFSLIFTKSVYEKGN